MPYKRMLKKLCYVKLEFVCHNRIWCLLYMRLHSQGPSLKPKEADFHLKPRRAQCYLSPPLRRKNLSIPPFNSHRKFGYDSFW